MAIESNAVNGAGHHQVTEVPGDTHLLEYLRMLFKRRWVFLGTLILVVGAGTYLSIMTTSKYRAVARLLIEVDRPGVLVFDETEAERDQTLDYRETQYRILQSRTLAGRTLEALRLWEHPQFGGAPPNPPMGEQAINAVRGFVMGLYEKLSRSPNYAAGALVEPEVIDLDAEFDWQETEIQTRAIDRFLGALDVEPVGESRLIDVRYTSVDPQLAAAVVNTLAEAYQEQNQEFKSVAADESAEWLGRQLEEHRSQLRESQLALQRYRETTSDPGEAGGGSVVQSRFEELDRAMMQTRTERIQKEALAKQVEAAGGDLSQLATRPRIASDPNVEAARSEIAALRRRDQDLAQAFGPRHPDRVAVQTAIQRAEEQLDKEILRVVDVIRNDYEAALAEEQSLATAVDAQRAVALRARAGQIEYDALERAATTDQEVFETLLQRAKEISVTTGMVASNIRLIDAASVPLRPSSPDRRLDLLLSLCVGILIALAATFFVDYMDKSINTPDGLSRAIGLTCLGMVPVVKGLRSSKAPCVGTTASSAFAEAFRVIRTKVLLALAAESKRSILVTSTGPDEGKTVVACNLAVVLAQTGQRVLIIDSDLRRPSVHKFFELSQEPGFSDVSSGRAKPSEVLRETWMPGLWMLASGRTPPNPSELLSSEPYRKFIDSLTEAFDWVIIDSPPVMAVTDATIVANVTSGVIFVVASDQADSAAAANAVAQLDVGHVRFVGAILNKVALAEDFFYYSSYYRPEYARYLATATPDSGDSPPMR